jgi:hypothetical protein
MLADAVIVGRCAQVHLGTQKKTSHNLRLVAADPVALLARDPRGEFTEIAAEQLMTSMAL